MIKVERTVMKNFEIIWCYMCRETWFHDHPWMIETSAARHGSKFQKKAQATSQSYTATRCIYI